MTAAAVTGKRTFSQMAPETIPDDEDPQNKRAKPSEETALAIDAVASGGLLLNLPEGIHKVSLMDAHQFICAVLNTPELFRRHQQFASQLLTAMKSLYPRDFFTIASEVVWLRRAGNHRAVQQITLHIDRTGFTSKQKAWIFENVLHSSFKLNDHQQTLNHGMVGLEKYPQSSIVQHVAKCFPPILSCFLDRLQQLEDEGSYEEVLARLQAHPFLGTTAQLQISLMKTYLKLGQTLNADLARGFIHLKWGDSPACYLADAWYHFETRDWDRALAAANSYLKTGHLYDQDIVLWLKGQIYLQKNDLQNAHLSWKDGAQKYPTLLLFRLCNKQLETHASSSCTRDIQIPCPANCRCRRPLGLPLLPTASPPSMSAETNT